MRIVMFDGRTDAYLPLTEKAMTTDAKPQPLSATELAQLNADLLDQPRSFWPLAELTSRLLATIAQQAEQMKAEYERGRADQKRFDVALVRARKSGHTIDISTGALVPDRDGPWFLKDHIASAIEAALNQRGDNE